MDREMILSKVDHTLLKPIATWEQIAELCDEAIANNTASVCIPPCYVGRVSEKYGKKLTVCTVVGFPLGYETTKGKVADTVQCLEDGAEEIDMVINIAEVKNGNYDYVRNEIKAIREVVGDKILKVIIETCYLTDEEKIKLCKIVTECNADYIKTSTGFGTNGATIEDIRLFVNNIGADVKIKAAGGIRTMEEAVAYLEEGCSRIGASSVLADVNAKCVE